MSVVLSNNFVLTEDDAGLTGALTADHPIVGWRNIVTTTNVAADTEATGYPVTNVANPATHRKWKAGSTAVQHLSVTTLSADDMDYVGLARHNLGTAGIAVSVGYYADGSPTEFVALTDPVIPADDGPLLFRFTPQPLSMVVIRLGTGSIAAEIAVLYVGRLLVLPRRLYQGMAAPPHARTSKVTNGRSESGDFLGRIVTQESIQAKVPLSLIEPAYYREHIDEFIAASKQTPFFFAWRPSTYPHEIAYALMTNDPVPINESPHGLIAMQFEFAGIV